MENTFLSIRLKNTRWREKSFILMTRFPRTTRLALIFFFLLLSSIAALWILDIVFPLYKVDTQQGFAQVITDRHGEPLRVFPDKNGVWRYPVALEDVSPHYIEALLTYEDQYFYQHIGVNPLALIRATSQALVNGRMISGGSTLSMQVARILDPHTKTFSGKIKQILRAIQLEWHYSKREILELYLARAPFGGTIEGVQAASYAYLGKSAAVLSHAEAALLAVLPQSPSRNRPDRHPQRAQIARNKVLDRLNDFGVWDAQTVNEAKVESVIASYNSKPKIAPLLARRLAKKHPTQALIKTTIDKNLQQNIARTVKNYAKSLPAKTSVAVLVLNNQDLSARAYVGSADFNDDQRFAHVDMILAARSPGSTLKPFLYGMAIDEGLIHEQSLLLDVPSNFSGYKPKNFDQDFNGVIDARSSLQASLNVPAVQVLDAFGPKSFYARLASAGLKLRLPKGSQPNLSIILGGTASTLEELSVAFASLQRKGLSREVQYIYNQKPKLERRMFSQESAWIVSDILKEASLNRFDRHSNIAKIGHGLPFKTGTSYGYRDAWVLASSKELTVGIWVGRPDGSALLDNYGRHTAVPLLRRVLKNFSTDQLETQKRPETVSRNKICWPLGSLQSLQESSWCMKEISAWLANDSAPANTLRDPLDSYWSGSLTQLRLNQDGLRLSPDCPADTIEKKTIALWPTSSEPWLPLHWRREHLIPALAPQCKETKNLSTLTIEGLENNTILQARPDEIHLPTIRVKARGHSASPNWFLNGHWQGESATIELRQLNPGDHRLSVMDDLGQFAEIHFRVEP
ncbi:MAG: penicillin-binding protein 1C [Flavobacteriales bacterium]|jgi:penicillin-binding protein 1C